MRFLPICLLLLTLAARAAEPFEIKDGDRVLLLGDTLLERENTYGYLETRMQEQFPNRHFTVRNLAFSADTPRGWSRASFDPAAQGFERLKEQIATVRPTVVFLGYGMAASLQEMTDRAGDPALNPDPARYGREPMSAARFKKELGELMDAITARDPATPVRFVLLSPIRHEDLRALRPGLPNPEEHNKLLAGYAKAVEELAKERAVRFWDTQVIKSPDIASNITDNGIHLNEEGYGMLAGRLTPSSGLGWSTGANLSQAQRDALRAAIIRKNELFFHQWRPANETYLFGFRKHEQGQNAKEMAEFEPLIVQAEAEIDRLKAAKGSKAAAAALPPAPQKSPAASAALPPAPPNSPAAAAALPPAPQSSPTAAAALPPAPQSSPAAAAALPPAPPNSPAAAAPQPPAPQSSPAVAAPGISAPQNTAAAAARPLPKPDFTLEDGYQIELWAENPLLYKPTQMNWDAQGRLWVTSSALYPMIAPGGQETDTVLVLEDTDHDGRADKSTVFAGGLLIPTGVVPALVAEKAEVGSQKPGPTPPAAPTSDLQPPTSSRYGCYVGQSTELLYFEDTDGDGQADAQRIVLSGFGTEDTHHIIHTLKWGPDGRLYFNQSVYIHSHVETPWGVVRLNAGGVLAWDPRTEKVEVFNKGLWNSWGHQFDEWGEHFQTDGAGSTGLTWSFFGATFAPFEGARRTMPSSSPGTYPKFAGLELIQSPAFPAEWQGNAITCDFRAHRIVRFGITDLARGEKPQAGFTTQELPDLVRTSDVTFRPIDVKLGPDGALYVADWSNPVINHGEVDFRDPRRDHTHGRIWRITKKETPVVKWEPLPRQPTEVLLDHLIGDNLWAREQARVVLRQRLSAEIAQTKAAAKATGQLVLDDDPTRVTTAMERWYQTDKAPAKLREVCLLEANFSTTGWSRFGALLESPDPRLRALVPRFMAALRSRRLFRASPPPPPAPKPAEGSQPSPRLANLYALPRLAADADPRVRLETLRTLARYRTPQSIDLVLNSALKTAGDPFLEFAAWQTMNDLAQPWTDSILKEEWKIEGREAQLDYGLNAIDPALAGVTLAKLLADGKIALNQGPWIELVGRAGGPAELAALFESLIISYGADCCPGRNMTAPRATSLDEPKAQRALAALLEAVRVRNVRPEGELALAALAAHAPEPLRAGFVRLAGYWKTQDAPEFLPALATTAETRPELRLAAIEGLRALGGPAAIRALEMVCTSEQPFGLRRSALLALAAQKFPAAAPLLAPILRTAPNENEVLATWRQLLAVQGAAGALEKQFSDAAWVKDLPPPVVMAAFRAARESGKKGQTLTQVLAPLVGASAAPVFTAEDYQRLAAAARVSGDPAQGELLYRQTASGCTTCHAIGGAGGMVGPALTSIGASAPLDYIIESMLAPNAKVKEGYNAVALKLRDGTEATGIQARETAQEVILRNIAGQETAVPKAAITGKTDVGSIMPAGLLEQFSERDRLNLYAFLGELGKPGPYDASKGSVARVWRLYSAAQEAQALKQDVTGFVPPVYTQVDGRLTQTALSEALPMIGDAGKDFYATAQFQVAAGGKVRLNFTGISTAWLDGQPLAIASEPSPAPELTPGVHTLTVKLDRTALPAVLRAEAPGANFLGN